MANVTLPNIWTSLPTKALLKLSVPPVTRTFPVMPPLTKVQVCPLETVMLPCARVDPVAGRTGSEID